jgi:tetratricopeptide (TPR) repeat protein
MLKDPPTRQPTKPLPWWFSVALFACFVLVIAGYLIFTQLNKRRVVSVYMQKATALKSHDQYTAAIETLAKASALDPENLQVQTEHLKTTIFRLTRDFDPLDRLLDLEKVDEAEADCKKLLEADPQSAELMALLGIIYAHKDRPALAIETYKKASEMNPSYPNVRNFWGYSMVEWGFPNDWKSLAVRKFEEAKELDGTYVNPRINLALLSLRDGKVDETIEQLKAAESISRENDTLYVLWAYAVAQQGADLKSRDPVAANQKFSDALEKYRIAIAVNPDRLASHINRAELFIELGSYEAAIEEFKLALKLEPSFVMGHKEFAETLLKRDSQPSDRVEALNHLYQAVKFTDDIIQQYQVRRARTDEEFARQKIDGWTKTRRDEKAELEKLINTATRNVSVSTRSQPAANNPLK